MTLVELLIYVGLMSFTVLVSATLIYNLFQTQARVKKTQTISSIVAQTVNSSRNPQFLRSALAPLVGCIQNSANVCSVTVSAPLPLSGITAPLGSACYSNTGQESCACSPTCSIQVLTNFQVQCSGGAGSRATCPANQANIRVDYAVRPHPTHSTIEQNFLTIQGTHYLKPNVLWGDTAQSSKGGTVTELKKNIYNVTTNCQTGEVVVGIQENGALRCKKIDHVCASGHILAGFDLSSTTANNYAFVPKCVSIICPTVGGKKQVFAGIDPATETPICRPLNASSTTCSPFTGGVPNGSFMVGLNSQSEPICRKKTCLPGEIFAGWDASGDAVCVTTGFIPKCVSPTCQFHTSTTPGAGFYYTSATAPAVSIPFEGIPYISQWSGGRPTQGVRHALRNWGGNISSNNRTNIFFSTMDSRGASKTFGGTSTTCQVDATYASNLRCLHIWDRVTRADGNCPSNTTSTRYTYIGGNQCQVESWQCTGATVWNPPVPPAVFGSWTCSTTYGWVITGATASETRTTQTSWGNLVNVNFGGSGFTADCNAPEPHYPNQPNPWGSVGDRKNSRYTSFTLVGGCNYVYTP